MAGVAANPAATYQWFRNGQSLAGETALTLTLTNVTSAATYTVVATNSYGSTPSAPVSVRLGASLDFGPSTPSQTVAAGSLATLTVSVQSPSPDLSMAEKRRRRARRHGGHPLVCRDETR